MKRVPLMTFGMQATLYVRAHRKGRAGIPELRQSMQYAARHRNLFENFSAHAAPILGFDFRI